MDSPPPLPRENPMQEPDAPEPPPLLAPCVSLSLWDPLQWIRAGWADIRRAPRQSLCYGLLMMVLGQLIALAAWAWGNLGLFLGMMTGFVFIGPLLAFTLYDISARLEKGLPVSLRLSLQDAIAQAGNAMVFTLVLTVVFLVWARAASMVHIFFPADLHARWQDIAMFLGVGSSIGAIFCAVVFAVSAFSLPMMMDRDVDSITAVITSVHAVLQNKPPMLVWAAIIVACVVVGFATAGLAFVVLLPLLGHATYHAYRHTIQPGAWPCRHLAGESVRSS